LSEDAARYITEKELLQTIIEMAEALGYMVYHVLEQKHYARRTSKGFPDLLLLRRNRVIVVECKSERGRVTSQQQEWLDEFRTIPGLEVYVWRPSDLDQIEEILR